MALMGQDNLKTNLSNLQRVYNWDVVIPNPIGGGDTDTFLVRAQSTNIPGRSVGKIAVPYKQSAPTQFTGKLTFPQSWECTFIEGEDKEIFDAIYAWNQQIVSDIDGIGAGDDAIKSDIKLVLLSTTGEVTNTIKLIGCFPAEVADSPLDYGTEEGVKYSVTFSYDRWEQVS